MNLILIGMSGVGKSYWTARLAAAGWTAVQADLRIADQLAAEGHIPAPTDAAMEAWLGLPYTPGYAEREAHFNAAERAVIEEIAAELEDGRYAPGHTIVDTGGSAVYLGDALWARLKAVATVVYLAVSPAVHRQMLAAYLVRTRPVIWNGIFQPLPGESDAEALARCYPELITTREQLYERYCDVKLAYAAHKEPGLTPADFLARVEWGGR